MASGQEAPAGPDLQAGIPTTDVPDGGMIAGHVGEEAVLLVHRGDEWFAIGATCSHYGGPLAEGLVVGDTVRCPWHHACFSLRTGEALRPPALNDLSCWDVGAARRTCVRVGAKRAAARRGRAGAPRAPESVVIVGGGAAGEQRRGNASARGVRGARHDRRSGPGRALRPAQPVQGLPGRQRARRVDPAASARLLRGAGDRAAARPPRGRHRPARPARAPRRRHRPAATARCCSPPGPTPVRLGPTLERRHAGGALPALAGRQPRDRRRRARRRPRGRARRELHRARGGGVAPRAKDGGPRGRARTRGRWSGCWARSSAT